MTRQSRQSRQTEPQLDGVAVHIVPRIRGRKHEIEKGNGWRGRCVCFYTFLVVKLLRLMHLSLSNFVFVIGVANAIRRNQVNRPARDHVSMVFRLALEQVAVPESMHVVHGQVHGVTKVMRSRRRRTYSPFQGLRIA